MTETSESRLERLRAEILAGRLSRRDVLRRAVALGLSAPVIASLLAACGDDDDDDAAETTEATATTAGAAQPTATTAAAEPTPTTAAAGETPTAAAAAESPTTAAEVAEEPGQGRGMADLVRILYWQAPTILNPHFAQGDKDSSAASVVLEPLVSYNPDGTLRARLVSEIPSLENGGVAEDGTSVTWKLKEGVVWSDGEPFTAEDVKFTYDFVIDPESSSTSFAQYQVIDSVEVVDELTVTVNFKQPNPEWFGPFGTGYGGEILPKHILQDFMGAQARDAEFNLNPIGTGAYKVAEFRPGDVVIYEMNELYRDETRPYFTQVELKGGGDATSAARAGIQTGETDWAWNLQVEKAVLEQIAAEGEFGELAVAPGLSIERILINFADPNTEVDGARSEPSNAHPFQQFKEVRQAFNICADRETIASELYGVAGQATPNLLVSPDAFVSPNNTFVFDTAAAAAALDAAGWTGSPRAKDGVEMRVLYQTTINPVRQKTQEIVKQAMESIGIPTEIKSIDAGVFFASDAGNPDTAAHFYADWEMYTNGPASPYPIAYMAGWKSDEPDKDLAQKANDWSGSNYNRWVNDEYNTLYRQAEQELDPAKQAELFIAMGELLVEEVVEIPLVHRAGVTGVNRQLKGYNRSPYEPDTYDVADWYLEE
jgi:peptide/nickel transport system substrate-binding protein